MSQVDQDILATSETPIKQQPQTFCLPSAEPMMWLMDKQLVYQIQVGRIEPGFFLFNRTKEEILESIDDRNQGPIMRWWTPRPGDPTVSEVATRFKGILLKADEEHRVIWSASPDLTGFEQVKRLLEAHGFPPMVIPERGTQLNTLNLAKAFNLARIPLYAV